MIADRKGAWKDAAALTAAAFGDALRSIRDNRALTGTAWRFVAELFGIGLLMIIFAIVAHVARWSKTAILMLILGLFCLLVGYRLIIGSGIAIRSALLRRAGEKPDMKDVRAYIERRQWTLVICDWGLFFGIASVLIWQLSGHPVSEMHKAPLPITVVRTIATVLMYVISIYLTTQVAMGSTGAGNVIGRMVAAVRSGWRECIILVCGLSCVDAWEEFSVGFIMDFTSPLQGVFGTVAIATRCVYLLLIAVFLPYVFFLGRLVCAMVFQRICEKNEIGESRIESGLL